MGAHRAAVQAQDVSVHVAWCAVLAALMALPARSGAAPPGVPGADRAAIEKLEQRWIADIAQGDRDDLATILADDYRDVDWQGRVRDKNALLAGIHRSADTSQHITELHVRAWGDTAVATGINEVHSRGDDRTVEVAFTDVFARVDGHWRAISSQETVRRPPASGARP